MSRGVSAARPPSDEVGGTGSFDLIIPRSRVRTPPTPPAAFPASSGIRLTARVSLEPY